MDRTGIIALWSPPRARSTAFFRAMLERGDLVALHEPFCNLADYGETQAGDETVRGAPDLIAAMWRLAERGVVFFKDTTDHRYGEVLADARFLREAQHTFLLRRPEEVAASFFALKPDMGREELGFAQMYEIFAAARDAGGRPPVVVDSDDLVAQPARTIEAYCAAVGLPFLAHALGWQPGARPEWGRSDRWHHDVADSTSIARREHRYDATAANNARLAEFTEYHRPFYDLLMAVRLPV